MRAIATLSLSALILGGTVVGCSHGATVGAASDRGDARLAKRAASHAEKAQRALAKGDAAEAVGLAEAAVAGAPRNAGYRSMLAAAYLKAGRFTSAHSAYEAVLQLSPDDGKAALNLALAMIAEGQWEEARALLGTHAAIVPAADRGLALALAGDTATGIEVLTTAARAPDSDAKTRQNLALTLALAGRWAESRQVAGIDMAPAEADARVLEWTRFAKPVGAADQVSTLLGITPVNDPGQPVALALNAAAPVVPATAEPTKLAAADPAEAGAEAGKATPLAQAPVEVAAALAPAADVPAVRRIQTAMVTNAAPAANRPAGAGKATPRPLAKGKWYVQLGAYGSPALAKSAWNGAKRRYPAFAEQTPTGMTFRSVYRLSVGGFAQGDAAALCRGYRANGGKCFVRTGADQVAQWAKPAKVQLAGR